MVQNFSVFPHGSREKLVQDFSVSPRNFAKKPFPDIIAGNGSLVYSFYQVFDLWVRKTVPDFVDKNTFRLFLLSLSVRNFRGGALVQPPLSRTQLNQTAQAYAIRALRRLKNRLRHPASRLIRTRSACCGKPAAPEQTPDIRPRPAFQSAVPAGRPRTCTARSSGSRGGVRDRSILHYPKG